MSANIVLGDLKKLRKEIHDLTNQVDKLDISINFLETKIQGQDIIIDNLKLMLQKSEVNSKEERKDERL